MKYIYNLLTILLIGVAVFLVNENRKSQVALKDMQNHIDSLKTAQIAFERRNNPTSSQMQQLNIYYARLYFAGQNTDEGQTNYYLDKLEKSYQQMQHTAVGKDSTQVAEWYQKYGLSAVEYFRQGLNREGMTSFGDGYVNLMNGCNSCHAASARGFLKITYPVNPPVDDLEFQHKAENTNP